jgi:sensor histidine kinase
MVWTDKVRNLKFIFIGVAIIIVATSLFVSHRLVEDLKNEERTRMEVWAAAMRSLTEAEENTDLNLVLTVINGNNSIPVIVTDEENKILSHRNLGIQSRNSQDSLKQLQGRLTEMRQTGKHMKMPLEITSQDDNTTTQSSPVQLHHINIYYEESLILHRLALFPYVQLAVVSLFLLVALVALLSTKKAEQNRVWVGLTKETAHQLGTPISSLMAWIEVLKETYPNDDLLEDMQTDVQRLERITERFSKIGSQPVLVNTSISPIIAQTVSYLQRRISSRITITSHIHQEVELPLSAPLFEWVLEVLCKNSADAMSGAGSIEISGQIKDDRFIIDVTDTGKGIARKNFSSVFKAGYTTKQRGWGLGLSLSKRIIEKYHHGRIYVFQSIVGKGTTFRIELPLISC